MIPLSVGPVKQKRSGQLANQLWVMLIQFGLGGALRYGSERDKPIAATGVYPDFPGLGHALG